MQKEMVRYSNLENNRKDTLFTFREGDIVYFGIARCNLRAGDQFDRELGKKIAKARALKGYELVKSGEETQEEGTLENIDYNVNHGSINVNNVKSLLNYFHTLKTTVRL